MDPATCANCDAELHGSYCHRCGQKDLDLDRPFFSLVSEWLGNLFAFDARVWRTLGPLLARPGFLTTEYLAGRRVRYVPPLRLYFFASVAMFLALAWSGHSIVTSDRDADEPVKIYTVEGEQTDTDGGLGPWFQDRLDRIGEAPPDTVNAMYRQRLAQTLIVLAFVFAVFTRLIFWRSGDASGDGTVDASGNRLFHHLIFSVHVHAAAFLGIVGVHLVGSAFDSVTQLAGGGAWAVGILGLLYLPALALYVFLALRRVFRRSRGATFWRFALLGVVYLVSLAWTLMATMLLAAGDL